MDLEVEHFYFLILSQTWRGCVVEIANDHNAVRAQCASRND